MTLHCAFIGFGKSTTRYHLPYVLHRKDSWHVAHIYRRRAKPEEQSPQYSHIHFTSDLDEILNDPQVKLVVVCTHADSHFDYAKRALEAGKNVLVEKPFTPTIAEAKALFALAKSKGLTVTPYQNRRFDSCFLTAKKAIESGTGARGLRGIMERVLGKLMFELPSDKTAAKVIVTKECVEQGTNPIVEKKSAKKSPKPAEDLKIAN